MKLGLGLYRHMLTRENFRFARQAGATAIVAHLVDYFAGGSHGTSDNQPTGTDRGWGRAGDPDRLWTAEELVALREAVEAEGLTLEAIENFDPAHWHDVLLDGPARDRHIENVKTIVRRLGEAGVPIMGYNFSIAGVGGRVTGPFARGGALSVGMDGPLDTPMPNGMVWNMVYDEAAPAGTLEPITRRRALAPPRRLPRRDRPGRRRGRRDAGRASRRSADPDPARPAAARLPAAPLPAAARSQAEPSQRARVLRRLDCRDDRRRPLRAVDTYSRQGKLAYVHFRNVTGKVPHYRETFVDDGDVDMVRVLRILRKNGYEGVLIPDHTPQMTCDAPWHAGMAWALGYMRAALQIIDDGR